MVQSKSVSALLTLVHLSDSALPIGGFSHSWGLETWCLEGRLQLPDSVAQAISQLLEMSVLPQDGRACAIAHQAAQLEDKQSFATLNQSLTASRWAPEQREASLQLGARLFRLAQNTGLLANFSEQFAAVHHCAAFGWLCGMLGLSRSDTVAAYLYTCVSAMVSACVRLIPLGQTDGQRIIVELLRNSEELLDRCLPELATEASLSSDDLASFSPMHEQACVEHQFLYSRIFQS